MSPCQSAGQQYHSLSAPGSTLHQAAGQHLFLENSATMQHLPAAKLHCVNNMPPMRCFGAHRCWKREACKLEGSSSKHGQKASVRQQMVQSEVPATACQDPAGRHCRLSVQHRHLCLASDAERPPSCCQSAPSNRRCRWQVDSIIHNILAAARAHVDAWGTSDQQASCSIPTSLPGQLPALHPQPQLHSVTPPDGGPGSLPARSLHDIQQQNRTNIRWWQPTAGQWNSQRQLSLGHNGPSARAARTRRPSLWQQGLACTDTPITECANANA